MKKLFYFTLFLAFLSCQAEEKEEEAKNDIQQSSQIQPSKPLMPSDPGFSTGTSTNNSSTPTIDLSRTLTPAKELYAQVQKNQVDVLFHGKGNDPNWDMYIMNLELLFVIVDQNIYENFYLLTPFDPNKIEQVIKYQSNKGKVIQAKLVKSSKVDQKTGKMYEYTIIRSTDYPQLNGFGKKGL